MPIGASHIVGISPRVLSGGSSDLETNGMLLSKSPLISTNLIAQSFSSAEAVASTFGYESDEYLFAQQYFTGFENAQTSVKTLVIARRIDEAWAAWSRSGA